MVRITLIALVLTVTTMSLAFAQRPPYAGSRPIGYKDRFRPRPTGSAGGVTATANDIDNRFGELANNLDNSTNVTQRPPVGVEVVYGEPSEPDEQQPQQESTRPDQQQQQPLGTLDIVNRLGGADQLSAGNDQQQQQGQTSSSSSSGSASFSSTSSTSAQGINSENSPTDLFAGGDSRKPAVASFTTVATPTGQRRPTTVIPFRQTTLNHVPYDAHGDVFLVNLLNQRPVDQQPFWFVNYQAIEAHRNGTRS